MTFSIRLANTTDTESLAAFVNSAYRGESSKAGWTTEADLLGGQRIDSRGIHQLITALDSVVLILQNPIEENTIGCVHLQRNEPKAYLGMFTVSPILQGKGIGKYFLEQIEKWVVANWQSQIIEMTVITVRTELIDFYKRRGFKATGKIIDFPTEEKFGIQKQKLFMEYLQKQL